VTCDYNLIFQKTQHDGAAAAADENVLLFPHRSEKKAFKKFIFFVSRV
jgi:hypothetical protein